MRIIHIDRKTGEIKIQADTLDDLWHLEKVVNPGDEAEGKSWRTYKVGTKEEKKAVTIRVKVERVEFAKSANRLRLLGIIVSGSPEEYVQIGKHHSIEIGPDARFKIIKVWKKHEIDRLREAEKETKKPRVNILVLDEEKALLAVVKPYGVDYGIEIENAARKRGEDFEQREKEYFGKIMAEIERKPEHFIIAGPGFSKDNLKKFIQQRKPELISRITFESCSYAERNGVNELLKKGIVEKVAGEARYEKEEQLMEKFMEMLHRDTGKAVYGIVEVKKAVSLGALEKLFVLDEFLRTNEDAEALIDEAEKAGAAIVIFSSEGDAGLKLKGLGRIAGLLRWKIE
ncbi:mRNA surveillance protein pelota [Candidatus Micrarchaeota archaeon]|nr:mRNA surveillance protein pelota [Candidatus Micrarchaeota archaeon]